MAASCRSSPAPFAALERPRHFLGAVALDHVAHLHVVEVLDADAALEAFADLAHVLLEAAERPDDAVEDLHAVADEADARARAADGSRAHGAAGDEADLRHLERLAHLGLAEHDFLLHGAEHAFHRRADL